MEGQLDQQQDEYTKQATKMVLAYYNLFKAPQMSDSTMINLANFSLAKKCALITLSEKIQSVQLQRELYAPLAAWELNTGSVSQQMQDCCIDHIKELGKLKLAIEQYQITHIQSN